MPKNKDGSVSMTLQLPWEVYYLLKRIAEKDRRSMQQEVFFLIEQAADSMNVGLDLSEENVLKHLDLTTDAPAKQGRTGPRLGKDEKTENVKGKKGA